MLAELLDLQLDPARIDAAAPDFEGRYGFRRRPDYVRLRTAVTGAPYTELTVRADELTAPPLGVTHAYIVENEITYLAFPLVPDATVIFGGGYAVNVLERLDWLVTFDLVYWARADPDKGRSRLAYPVRAEPLPGTCRRRLRSRCPPGAGAH